MTTKITFFCNLCGISNDVIEVEGLIYDTHDELQVVAPNESPMHICSRCKGAIHDLAEREKVK